LFYQKKIKVLQEALDLFKAKAAEYYSLYSQESLARSGAEDKIVDFEAEIKSLDEELARFHEINVALADENRDLTNRLYFLESVLGQLQIPVKLPVKKSRG
jgi:hypothetical protein